MAASAADLALTIADASMAVSAAAADAVANAAAAAVAEGATLTITPATMSAAVTPAAAPPPPVWLTAAYALAKGTAAAAAAATALRLLKQDVGPTIPEDGPPPHHLRDVPLLLARASVAGLRQPARWLLWPTTALFCARCGGEVVSALLAKTDGALSLAADPVAALLAQVDRYTGSGSTAFATVLLCWIAIAFKDEALKLVLTSPEVPDDWAIIAGPLSAIATGGICITGGLSTAASLGVNLEPVMAVGGISTIILGFGSQIVTANAISGVDLYISQTLRKGERVVLLTTGGDTVVTGVVEAISLLYTTVRTDLGVPVSIPNKAVAEMLVKNESRLRWSSTMLNFRAPRQLLLSFRLRLQDRDLLDDVLAGIKQFLDSSPDVDQALPHGASLAKFGDYYIEIGMLAHGVKENAGDFAGFQQKMLREVEAVIRAKGADFPLPTSLLYSTPPLEPQTQQQQQ